MKFLYLRFLSPQQGGNIPQLHTIKANSESHLRLARGWRQFLSCFMFLYHMFYLLPILETLATAPKEKKVDDMAETRERGFATARKFRAGGCCQICETKFYRELAFLEVSEDHKLETVSRFHTWNSYGSPVDNFHKPVLHEELQRHYKPTKDRLADLQSTFLELNERLKKENLFKKAYSAAANTLAS